MNDIEGMTRCLALAARAAGRTSPNPMVGAVVVREGQVVGEGWHTRAGAEHAEVVALRQADSLARGAVLYVNLEPCAHFGRTPPCTDAILQAGIRRVVAGMVDPHPRVNGRGVARLREAGLDVEMGVLEAECRELNRAFVTAVTLGRPFVLLKAASTLDGHISTSAGESRWITGEEARLHGHVLRDRLDAILVGAGTAIADDPHLNCRIDGGRDPVPIILDSRLRVPRSARVFAQGRGALVYTRLGNPTFDHPAQVVPVPFSDTGLSIPHVLADLHARGIQSILVEGGGKVHRSFLASGLVDRICLQLSPQVLAGGPSWVGGAPIPHLADAFRFRILSFQRQGDDLMLDLVPQFAVSEA